MNLHDNSYVVFDLETTGLDPNKGCSIIEIGAVKLVHGKIVDRYDRFVNPKVAIDDDIIRITGITNEMVENADSEETVVKDFINWCSGNILVAHNAKFDLSFIKMAYLKYRLGRFNFDVIDTLGLSKFLAPYERYHNLTCLMERYNITWDEDKHHRADYDSEGTALVFMAMISELSKRSITTFDELERYPKIILNEKI